GGFVAALLEGKDEPAAIARGLVSASFALQGWGASALLAAKPEDAEARLRLTAQSPKPRA
ncbi:MAG: hypothetical protein AB7I50_06190, partial [Vicinamibacterales bacterium]